MNNKVLLLGAGGHARVLLETLKQKYSPADLGIVDPHLAQGDQLLGVRVVGGDGDLPRLYVEGWRMAALGVGSVTDCSLRERLAERLRAIGFSLPAVVDESAIIGEGTSIGQGSFIGRRVIVQTGACIGQMCILNTGCIVEHDSTVGDFAHISTGSILLGCVTIGYGSLVGGGSVVRQGTVIGARTVIGAGSVVVSDLPDRCVAYGNPCQIRRTGCTLE